MTSLFPVNSTRDFLRTLKKVNYSPPNFYKVCLPEPLVRKRTQRAQRFVVSVDLHSTVDSLSRPYLGSGNTRHSEISFRCVIPSDIPTFLRWQHLTVRLRIILSTSYLRPSKGKRGPSRRPFSKRQGRGGYPGAHVSGNNGPTGQNGIYFGKNNLFHFAPVT